MEENRAWQCKASPCGMPSSDCEMGFPQVVDPWSEAEGSGSWILPQSGQETEEGLFSIDDPGKTFAIIEQMCYNVTCDSIFKKAH